MPPTTLLFWLPRQPHPLTEPINTPGKRMGNPLLCLHRPSGELAFQDATPPHSTFGPAPAWGPGIREAPPPGEDVPL